jgi:hypothetical protein
VSIAGPGLPRARRRRKGLKREAFAPLLYAVSGTRDGALHALAAAVAEMLDASKRVCFKLEQEQILLATNRSAWMGEATVELDEAVREFAQSEWVFRETLGQAAATFGVAPESTLREVAGIVEQPWDFIFSEGAEELRDQVAAIESHKGMLRELLTRNYMAVSAALDVLGVSPPNGYDAYGGMTGSPTRAMLFNQRI